MLKWREKKEILQNPLRANSLPSSGMAVLFMMHGLVVLLIRQKFFSLIFHFPFSFRTHFVIIIFLFWSLMCFLILGSFHFLGFLQVAQVLLTLPYSFSQLGMLSGILFQLFYGLMGSWTAYLISVLYVEYRTRKEREKVDFRNHVIQVINFLITYTHFPKTPLDYFPSFCSGLKFLMGCWGNTGEMLACFSNVLFSFLDL